MPSNTKRSCRDAEMRLERAEYKFVNEYVKHLHKDTYMKAKELYSKIRKMYSNGVRDITKTVEFFEATNQKIIPRHYSRKRKAEVEMVLRIPLMASPPTVPPVSSTAVASSSTTESMPPDNTFEQTMAQSPTTEPVEPSLLLSNNTFQQLMAELQNDPELMQILDGFPAELQQNDPELMQNLDGFPICNQDDDMLFETTQGSMTPLERELSMY